MDLDQSDAAPARVAYLRDVGCLRCMVCSEQVHAIQHWADAVAPRFSGQLHDFAIDGDDLGVGMYEFET